MTLEIPMTRKIRKCISCGKETRNPKFCSRSCAAHYNNKKFPKRTAKEWYCIICGVTINKHTKYCAKHVRIGLASGGKKSKGRAKKLHSHCCNCGKLLTLRQLKFCSRECQQDYIRDEYIYKWLSGSISGNRNVKTVVVSRYIRSWFLLTIGKCQKCGWNEINPTTGKSPLNIHHKDGDSTNSSYSNLELLCPNCHSLTDTYCNLNNGNGRSWR